MAMTDMDYKEKDRNVALAFMEAGLKAHVSKKNEIFMNGKILRVFEEFFVIDDIKYGSTNVFFDELNKPLEEFREVTNG